MQFKDIPQALGQLTRDQLDARSRRLSDPRLQHQLENMKLNIKQDLYNSCMAGGKALGRLSCAPIIGMYEGFIGTPIKTFTHNSSVRNPKHKKQYPNVLGTTVTETLTQYGKGVWNAGELIAHLTKLTGRSSLLATRYLIGK